MSTSIAGSSPRIRELPEALRERTRQVQGHGENESGEFVLYWMHHAMRGTENPALDVAIEIANSKQCGVVVYQELLESQPYASDRHHRFVLEGARDVAAQLRERNIPYWLHVERRSAPGSHIGALARRARFVVTEDMPIEPYRTWCSQLEQDAAIPLLRVDTACVMPMLVVGRAHDRAFQYRQATAKGYARRVKQAWQDAVSMFTGKAPTSLPFTPVAIETVGLAELIRECEIDHAIGAIPKSRGGSTAGYQRWARFFREGLDSYARRRNDPLVNGTSRLSPYLHYGMVSPFRIAREAAARGTDGAEKFLDELLIWRELAYAFCLYQPDVDSVQSLPAWARQTLREHESDPRPAILSWETLSRAQTGDPLWDAAQLSLLRQGELHNNVRMTWGKAFANWTADASRALERMIDLNHRYALDGRDPASYGGLLWCLGQFDRPFPPERPILGTVRERSTAEHAARLDVDRYRQLTSQPLFDTPPRVAVIGAGISGLFCGRTLVDQGCDVIVFEKSRGAGGRMATRRADAGVQFDHGAQYFTVKDERFARYVRSWQEDGLVARWEGRFATLCRGTLGEPRGTIDRYVATPGMNALCKHLAAELTIKTQVRVGRLTKTQRGWQLHDDQGVDLGEFDAVVVSTPAPQAAELLLPVSPLGQQAASVTMDACWAAMIAFSSPLPIRCDGAFVDDSPLAWIARDSSKPGRKNQPESWVLHASRDWTRTHLEADAADVLTQLLTAFWEATSLPPAEPITASAHRWRYALADEPHTQRCLFDAASRLVACGDWCSGPRVEGAFLSGMAAAGALLDA
jgi:hypothetical protein